mgnify:CR=1 FL=1
MISTKPTTGNDSINGSNSKGDTIDAKAGEDGDALDDARARDHDPRVLVVAKDGSAKMMKVKQGEKAFRSYLCTTALNKIRDRRRYWLADRRAGREMEVDRIRNPTKPCRDRL